MKKRKKRLNVYQAAMKLASPGKRTGGRMKVVLHKSMKGHYMHGGYL